jgi:rhamnogalacturonyl hydrolase YesR
MLMTSAGIKWIGSVAAVVATVAICSVCARGARTGTELPSRQANLRTRDSTFLADRIDDAAGRASDDWSWREARLPRTGSARDAFDTLGVAATLVSVADWQLREPVHFDPGDWTVAPLCDGMIDASLVTGDPKYLAAVVRAGRQEGLQPVPRVYVADDRAIGHAWLRILLMDPNASVLFQPFSDRFDRISANPIHARLISTRAPDTSDVAYRDRWTSSDGLRMTPPTLALLARATGDQRYLPLADAEFSATYDALFDQQAKLVYCDARFVDMRTPNGQKVFWSFCSGSVYSGLALLLDALPARYPKRELYVRIFQQMTDAVLAAQQPDGFWYPSLADPKHVPIGDTSGSALFLVGLAWGARSGLLERPTVWPAVERGWRAVATRITSAGEVATVQPIASAPPTFDPFLPASHQAFRTGAVLMAGAQIVQALGAQAKVDPMLLFSRATTLAATVPESPASRNAAEIVGTGAADRAYTIAVLTRIAEPVLESLSKGELKKRMPVHEWDRQRAASTHYEAFARTLAGVAPWLSLGEDDSAEGRTRARFIRLARQSLINATDPRSPDYMNFGQLPDQSLVESAYLGAALLQAPKELWEPLTAAQRTMVLDALKMSRRLEPHQSKWLLSAAMVEAVLWQLEGHADRRRIETALSMFERWYLGDGTYGDGPQFRWDYDNSYLIHPVMLSILRVLVGKFDPLARLLPVALERAQRNGEILERLISPEGTFPLMGRSSAHRFAAFDVLTVLALHGNLPESLDAGGVRSSITAVIRRMIDAPGTFDTQGWLTPGAVGAQPGLREEYETSGSLYACLTGLAHLGLPPNDYLWTAPAAPWTQQRIWAGLDVPRDQALENRKKK